MIIPGKGILYVFAFLISGIGLHAQNNVGIGTSNPDGSAKLEISSTDQGVLVPRMTLVQKNAITTPATGLLVYQIDADSGFHYFDGTAWRTFMGGGGTGSGQKYIHSPLLGWGNVALASTAEAFFYRFVLMEDMVVNEIFVMIDNVLGTCNQTFEFGIYDAQTLGGDRRPFNQLSSKTEIISENDGPGIRSITFPAPINLTAGEVYFVAMMRTAGTTFCIDFAESIEVKPRRQQGLPGALPATAGSTSGVSIPNIWFGLR